MDKTPKRPLEIKQAHFEKIERFINETIGKFHSELFYEEYDERYDSNAEAHERSLGKNPMDTTYVKAYQEKREALGVTPLRENGTSADYSSERYIHEKVFTFLEELRQKTAISEHKRKGSIQDVLKKH